MMINRSFESEYELIFGHSNIWPKQPEVTDITFICKASCKIPNEDACIAFDDY